MVAILKISNQNVIYITNGQYNNVAELIGAEELVIDDNSLNLDTLDDFFLTISACCALKKLTIKTTDLWLFAHSDQTIAKINNALIKLFPQLNSFSLLINFEEEDDDDLSELIIQSMAHLSNLIVKCNALEKIIFELNDNHSGVMLFSDNLSFIMNDPIRAVQSFIHNIPTTNLLDVAICFKSNDCKVFMDQFLLNEFIQKCINLEKLVIHGGFYDQIKLLKLANWIVDSSRINSLQITGIYQLPLEFIFQCLTPGKLLEHLTLQWNITCFSHELYRKFSKELPNYRNMERLSLEFKDLDIDQAERRKHLQYWGHKICEVMQLNSQILTLDCKCSLWNFDLGIDKKIIDNKVKYNALVRSMFHTKYPTHIGKIPIKTTYFLPNYSLLTRSSLISWDLRFIAYLASSVLRMRDARALCHHYLFDFIAPLLAKYVNYELTRNITSFLDYQDLRKLNVTIGGLFFREYKQGATETTASQSVTHELRLMQHEECLALK